MKRSFGIAFSYLHTAVNVVVSLVLASYLLRMLGDTEYGLYQTVASFVNYLVLFEFGVGTVMTRNVAVCRSQNEPEKLEKTFSTVFTITIAFSLLIAAVSLLFYRCLAAIYVKTMTADQVQYARKLFIPLTAFLLVSFFTQSFDGFLLGMEQYSYAKLRAIVISVCKLILTLVLIYIKRYALIVVLIDLVLSLLGLAFTLDYCRRHYGLRYRLRSFDRGILLASAPLCFALFLQSIINQANSNVDKFVIGVMMSVEDVALYSVTQFFYTIFAALMTIPVSMYLPEMASVLASRPSGEELTDKLIAPGRMEAMIGGLILGGILAVGRPFIALFFGASKVRAWYYAVVVLIPMYVNMTNAVIISVLDVLNKRLARSLALLATAVLNIILTVILIGRYGILGAVIGTAVSLILGNILILNLYYSQKLGIRVLRLFRESYRGILLPWMLAAAIGYALSSLIEAPLLSFLCGGTVFMAVSLLLIGRFGLNPEEKQRVHHLLRKLGKR